MYLRHMTVVLLFYLTSFELDVLCNSVSNLMCLTAIWDDLIFRCISLCN